MSNPFFEHPILNSPYERPGRLWELDRQGQPTEKIIKARRRAGFNGVALKTELYPELLKGVIELATVLGIDVDASGDSGSETEPPPPA